MLMRAGPGTEEVAQFVVASTNLSADRSWKRRTSRYLNNRLEQDHRGIKGRYQPMRGFKCPRVRIARA
jgi:transposase-like protein